MIEDCLIAPYERLAKSRREMAADEGISVRTLQLRLKAARDRAGRCGLDGLPFVEIANHETGGHHYRTDVDQLSRLPSGIFLIGDHFGRRLKLQRSSGGRHVRDAKPSNHKFRPKTSKRAKKRQPSRG